MPKLHVFDDDSQKLAIADGVLTALKSIDSAWQIGFKKDLTSNWREAISTLKNAADCVCVIDVEIKRASPTGWEDDGFDVAIKSFETEGLLSCSEQTSETKRGLRGLFGEEDDYKWAVCAFAYASQRRIPCIAISTKYHATTGDPFNNVIKTNGFESLFQWKPDLLDLEDARKRPQYEAMARTIHAAWQKWYGNMEGRIWGSNSAQQPNSRKDWFHSGDTHPSMKHDFSSCTSENYKREMRGFLDSVINKGKQDPIDFSNYEITRDCHEAIKKLVGAVAKVDHGSAGDRVPDLNTIVLLAAAWDPNAKDWFSAFQWNATHPVMCEAASKLQLRKAILDIGGEAAFLQGMLIEHIAEPKNGKWLPEQSFVKEFRVSGDSVLIEFKESCLKLAENFNAAKIGNTHSGGTCEKLVTAWASLAICGGRTVDIVMQPDEVSFIRFTKT